MLDLRNFFTWAVISQMEHYRGGWGVKGEIGDGVSEQLEVNYTYLP